MKESDDQLRMMADKIPRLVWACHPDGKTEFLVHPRLSAEQRSEDLLAPLA